MVVIRINNIGTAKKAPTNPNKRVPKNTANINNSGLILFVFPKKSGVNSKSTILFNIKNISKITNPSIIGDAFGKNITLSNMATKNAAIEAIAIPKIGTTDNAPVIKAKIIEYFTFTRERIPQTKKVTINIKINWVLR